MCLMCEFYLATCAEAECVADAKQRAETVRLAAQEARQKGLKPVDTSLLEEHYRGRTGVEYFLWKGYSDKPCKHIQAAHGVDCNVVKKTETEYGLLFDTCNCEQRTDGGYDYY